MRGSERDRDREKGSDRQGQRETGSQRQVSGLQVLTRRGGGRYEGQESRGNEGVRDGWEGPGQMDPKSPCRDWMQRHPKVTWRTYL